MPNGRVRWYDSKKGYGFICDEEGKDVFLPSSALPESVKELRKGTRVEFSVVEGRKGPQAMGLTVVASAPSLVKATRPKAEDMAAIVEDLIKLLILQAMVYDVVIIRLLLRVRNLRICCVL